MKSIRLLPILAIVFAGSLYAQSPIPATVGGTVVASCGTRPSGYPAAGSQGPMTVDTNGVACSSATISGSTITVSLDTSGLSTSANQSTANSSLSSIATNTTGAATATKQDTGNTSLGTLAGGVSGSKYQTNGAQIGGVNAYVQSAGVATLATAGSAQVIDNFNYYGNGVPMLPTDVGLVEIAASSNSAAAASACYVKSGTGTINDTTNHANCKSSAGNFYGARAINTTATLAYLRMYNLAADPTCSSSTGFIESIPIPANVTGAGYIDINSSIPFNYSTGISYCVTGGSPNNDNTAPVAGVFITLKYK